MHHWELRHHKMPSTDCKSFSTKETLYSQNKSHRFYFSFFYWLCDVLRIGVE